MALPEKITKTVEKARTIWAALVITVFFALLAFKPGWMVILIVPFAVISYFLTLLVVSLYLSTQLTIEELEEAERESYTNLEKEKQGLTENIVSENIVKEVKQVPPGLRPEMRTIDRVEVSKTSDPIGTYKDKEIYEWIEVLTPATNKMARFMYHGPTPMDGDVPLIPIEDGKLFANVNGVLYVYTEPDKN